MVRCCKKFIILFYILQVVIQGPFCSLAFAQSDLPQQEIPPVKNETAEKIKNLTTFIKLWNGLSQENRKLRYVTVHDGDPFHPKSVIISEDSNELFEKISFGELSIQTLNDADIVLDLIGPHNPKLVKDIIPIMDLKKLIRKGKVPIEILDLVGDDHSFESIEKYVCNRKSEHSGRSISEIASEHTAVKISNGTFDERMEIFIKSIESTAKFYVEDDEHSGEEHKPLIQRLKFYSKEYESLVQQRLKFYSREHEEFFSKVMDKLKADSVELLVYELTAYCFLTGHKYEILDMVLTKYRVDINLKDEQGRTMLGIATMLGNREIEEIYEKHGANADELSKDNSPLDACYYKIDAIKREVNDIVTKSIVFSSIGNLKAWHKAFARNNLKTRDPDLIEEWFSESDPNKQKLLWDDFNRKVSAHKLWFITIKSTHDKILKMESDNYDKKLIRASFPKNGNGDADTEGELLYVKIFPFKEIFKTILKISSRIYGNVILKIEHQATTDQTQDQKNVNVADAPTDNPSKPPNPSAVHLKIVPQEEPKTLEAYKEEYYAWRIQNSDLDVWTLADIQDGIFLWNQAHPDQQIQSVQTYATYRVGHFPFVIDLKKLCIKQGINPEEFLSDPTFNVTSNTTIAEVQGLVIPNEMKKKFNAELGYVTSKSKYKLPINIGGPRIKSSDSIDVQFETALAAGNFAYKPLYGAFVQFVQKNDLSSKYLKNFKLYYPNEFAILEKAHELYLKGYRSKEVISKILGFDDQIEKLQAQDNVDEKKIESIEAEKQKVQQEYLANFPFSDYELPSWPVRVYVNLTRVLREYKDLIIRAIQFRFGKDHDNFIPHVTTAIDTKSSKLRSKESKTDKFPTQNPNQVSTETAHGHNESNTTTRSPNGTANAPDERNAKKRFSLFRQDKPWLAPNTGDVDKEDPLVEEGGPSSLLKPWENSEDRPYVPMFSDGGTGNSSEDEDDKYKLESLISENDVDPLNLDHQRLLNSFVSSFFINSPDQKDKPKSDVPRRYEQEGDQINARNKEELKNVYQKRSELARVSGLVDLIQTNIQNHNFALVSYLLDLCEKYATNEYNILLAGKLIEDAVENAYEEMRETMSVSDENVARRIWNSKLATKETMSKIVARISWRGQKSFMDELMGNILDPELIHDAFESAAIAGKLDITKEYYEKYVDIIDIEPEHMAWIIGEAMRYGHKDVVEYLFEHPSTPEDVMDMTIDQAKFILIEQPRYLQFENETYKELSSDYPKILIQKKAAILAKRQEKRNNSTNKPKPDERKSTGFSLFRQRKPWLAQNTGDVEKETPLFEEGGPSSLLRPLENSEDRPYTPMFSNGGRRASHESNYIFPQTTINVSGKDNIEFISLQSSLVGDYYYLLDPEFRDEVGGIDRFEKVYGKFSPEFETALASKQTDVVQSFVNSYSKDRLQLEFSKAITIGNSYYLEQLLLRPEINLNKVKYAILFLKLHPPVYAFVGGQAFQRDTDEELLSPLIRYLPKNKREKFMNSKMVQSLQDRDSIHEYMNDVTNEKYIGDSYVVYGNDVSNREIAASNYFDEYLSKKSIPSEIAKIFMKYQESLLGFNAIDFTRNEYVLRSNLPRYLANTQFAKFILDDLNQFYKQYPKFAKVFGSLEDPTLANILENYGSTPKEVQKLTNLAKMLDEHGKTEIVVKYFPDYQLENSTNIAKATSETHESEKGETSKSSDPGNKGTKLKDNPLNYISANAVAGVLHGRDGELVITEAISNWWSGVKKSVSDWWSQESTSNPSSKEGESTSQKEISPSSSLTTEKTTAVTEVNVTTKTQEKVMSSLVAMSKLGQMVKGIQGLDTVAEKEEYFQEHKREFLDVQDVLIKDRVYRMQVVKLLGSVKVLDRGVDHLAKGATVEFPKFFVASMFAHAVSEIGEEKHPEKAASLTQQVFELFRSNGMFAASSALAGVTFDIFVPLLSRNFERAYRARVMERMLVGKTKTVQALLRRETSLMDGFARIQWTMFVATFVNLLLQSDHPDVGKVLIQTGIQQMTFLGSQVFVRGGVLSALRASRLMEGLKLAAPVDWVVTTVILGLDLIYQNRINRALGLEEQNMNLQDQVMRGYQAYHHGHKDEDFNFLLQNISLYWDQIVMRDVQTVTYNYQKKQNDLEDDLFYLHDHNNGLPTYPIFTQAASSLNQRKALWDNYNRKAGVVQQKIHQEIDPQMKDLVQALTTQRENLALVQEACKTMQVQVVEKCGILQMTLSQAMDLTRNILLSHGYATKARGYSSAVDALHHVGDMFTLPKKFATNDWIKLLLTIAKEADAAQKEQIMELLEDFLTKDNRVQKKDFQLNQVIVTNSYNPDALDKYSNMDTRMRTFALLVPHGVDVKETVMQEFFKAAYIKKCKPSPKNFNLDQYIQVRESLEKDGLYQQQKAKWTPILQTAWYKDSFIVPSDQDWKATQAKMRNQSAPPVMHVLEVFPSDRFGTPYTKPYVTTPMFDVDLQKYKDLLTCSTINVQTNAMNKTIH